MPNWVFTIPKAAFTMDRNECSRWTETRRSPGEAWRLLPPVKDISAVEKRLEDGSVLSSAILPGVQVAFTKWLRVGNEKALVGRQGWLYYRPNIEYLTGRGFLEPVILKRRARSGGEAQPIQPDPVRAIAEFNRQLRARGIRLVVVPAPVKAMIHPDLFSARFATTREDPLQNSSYPQFLAALRREDVTVYDPAPLLLEEFRTTGVPQFLETDTHWTPQAMERVTVELAKLVQQLAPQGSPESPVYLRSEQRAANLGDIAEMLTLPKDQRLFRPQEVILHPVRDQEGNPWEPQRDADVLLLGDSYSNIYSLEGMHWGARAGLAEQLSLALQRPVDRIVINAGGAYSSRQQLVNEMRRGQDRLAGKRVVIYEFAIRDLSEGDWKLLEIPVVPSVPKGSVLPQPGAAQNPPAVSETTARAVAAKTLDQPPAGTSRPRPNQGLIVEGRIDARTASPAPGTVPYKDCVIALEMSGVRALHGALSNQKIIVFVWGLRDNKSVDAPFVVGRTLRLRLVPWATAESQYGGFNRVEPEDPEAMMLDTYWGEVDK